MKINRYAVLAAVLFLTLTILNALGQALPGTTTTGSASVGGGGGVGTPTASTALTGNEPVVNLSILRSKPALVDELIPKLKYGQTMRRSASSPGYGEWYTFYFDS